MTVLALIVVVIVIVVPVAATHLGMDHHEVALFSPELDDALRCDPIVFAQELQLDQVDDVGIGEDDGAPLLAMLVLVVAQGTSVWRTGYHGDRDVIDLGLHAKPHRDVPPRRTTQTHVDDAPPRDASVPRDKERHGNFVVGDSPFADHDDLAFRHLIVVGDRHVKVADAGRHAERCLRVGAAGASRWRNRHDYEGEHDCANVMAHSSLSLGMSKAAAMCRWPAFAAVARKNGTHLQPVAGTLSYAADGDVIGPLRPRYSSGPVRTRLLMSDTIRTGEATLRALLDAGEQRLAVLLDRSQRLRAERDPETLLRLVTSAAVDFAKTRVCGVGITDDNGGFERLVSSDDATAAEAERLFAPRADHPARRAIESRGVVLDGSSLFVPIASPSHVYGCLALIDKIGAPAFSDVDTQLAATFGAQVGIVYENARLLARLQAQTEAFRVQEEQTEFAMTAARIGVSYRDVGSSWVVMSKSLARLLGVPEDAGGMSQDELYTRTHPDDRARVRAAVEK